MRGCEQEMPVILGDRGVDKRGIQKRGGIGYCIAESIIPLSTQSFLYGRVVNYSFFPEIGVGMD